MVSFEVYASKVNIDLENQTAIVTGVEESDIVAAVGVEKFLNAMEFEDVHNYVIQRLNEDAE